MNSEIQFHKWNKHDYKRLYSSIRDILDINNLQFYMPFYSLYFYIHNKPKANHKIDMKRNYYLKEVLEITKSRYYNSNMFLKGNIYNESKNIVTECELFCKSIPILDPIHIVNNNYNLVNHNNYHLPSNYNYNTFHKINDMNNTAYIDVLCSFLFGNLTHYKKNPSFPLYYGSVNGIGDYNYDLTEDYDDIKNDRCFNENIDKGFKLEIYVSEDESSSESDESSSDDEDDKSDADSEPEKSDDEDEKYKDNSFDDCIAKLLKIPIQLLFIEKLEGTLEDLLDEDIAEDVLLSCIFQISFALTYLQKHFAFTHNDLHINNIMYKSTTTTYLYYKYNNIYFKVPTHGYIFKIIDFGRSIYTFKNKTYHNDVYSKYGEAEGQYQYPIPNVASYRDNRYKNDIMPNPSFDMCRLSTTMLDFIDENNDLYNFLNNIVIDKNGKNIYDDMSDSFDLYIDIAKNACNGIPHELIHDDIFKKYRIKKKVFPKRDYYCMD